jgi:hypothetical protein
MKYIEFTTMHESEIVLQEGSFYLSCNKGAYGNRYFVTLILNVEEAWEIEEEEYSRLKSLVQLSK